MEINKIIEMIEEKIKGLTSSPSSNEKLLFLASFLKNNPCELAELSNINIIDLTIAYICTSPSKLTFQEIKQCVEENRDMIERFSPEKQKKILNYLDQKLRQNPIINFPERKIEKTEAINFDSLRKLQNNCPVTFYKATALAYVVRELQFFLDEKEEQNLANIDGATIEIDNKTHCFNIKRIKDDLREIEISYQKEKKQERKEQKERAKKISHYQELIKILQEGKNKEITSLNKILSLINEESDKLEILRSIALHNQKHQETLLKEYQHLLKNSQNHYRSLLKRYHISLESLTEREKALLFHREISDIESILEALNSKKILNPSLFFYLLEYSELDIIKKIMNYVDVGILAKSFIEEHPELFTKECFLILLDNINTLQEKEINPKMKKVNQKILITPPSLLQKNLSWLEEYHLLGNLNKNEDLSFLTIENLERKIDFLLELGLEERLKESLTLLNNEEQRYLRLRLLKDLNIPIEEDLEEVLSTNQFMVPDEVLENYIENVAPMKVPITELSESEPNILERVPSHLPLTINIGNSLFSKNKIRRNAQRLRKALNQDVSLLTIITFDTILSEQEWKDVEKELQSKETGMESLIYKKN